MSQQKRQFPHSLWCKLGGFTEVPVLQKSTFKIERSQNPELFDYQGRLKRDQTRLLQYCKLDSETIFWLTCHQQFTATSTPRWLQFQECQTQRGAILTSSLFQARGVFFGEKYNIPKTTWFVIKSQALPLNSTLLDLSMYSPFILFLSLLVKPERNRFLPCSSR